MSDFGLGAGFRICQRLRSESIWGLGSVFFENRVPPKARHAYACDAWSGMLGAVMMGAILPFIYVIAREQLHATRVHLSILNAATVVPNLLAVYWANKMEGRLKMPFATWSWVIARAMFLFTIFAFTSNTFVLIVVLFWLVTSVSGPAYSALMKEVYPDEDRGRITAYARVCTMFSALVVTMGVGLLLKVVSFRYVFPVATLFGFASAYAFNCIPTSETSGDPSVPFPRFFWQSMKILLEDPGYRWFCAGIFILGAANLMAVPVIAAFQVDVLHVDTRWAAVIFVVTSIVQMRAYIFWGEHIDRKPADEAAAIGAAIFGLFMLAYCFVTQAWMLLPMAVILGVANAAAELAYLNGVLRYAPRDRITHYQATFAFLMGVRGLGAPFIGSLLIVWHCLTPRGVFAVTAAMMLLGAVVQLYGMRRHKPLENAGN